MSISAIKTRIETDRFEETLRFYTRIVGLNQLETWGQDGEGAGAIFGTGGKDASGFLEIGYSDNPKIVDHALLQFRTTRIDEFLQRIEGKWAHSGVSEKTWGSKYVYLRDPNGLKVIVFEGEI
jgi:catechol 2,3-dioxygenase-like lactoylglutathione lyase family enzyme